MLLKRLSFNTSLSMAGFVLLSCGQDLSVSPSKLSQAIQQPLQLTDRDHIVSVRPSFKPLKPAKKGEEIDFTGLMYIVHSDGKANAYLKGVAVDRFHVIHDSQGSNAYLIRLSETDLEKYDEKSDAWFLLRNGQPPVLLKGASPYGLDTQKSEFIGQTMSSFGLVFSHGTYFDLSGKRISFADDIPDKEIVQANFVSGDYVAIARRVKDKDISIIVNVATHWKRSYGHFFTPDFVQIGNDSLGLMSDITEKKISVFDSTSISKLEDEFNSKYLAAEERGPTLLPSQTGNCQWFNASVQIEGESSALLNCFAPSSSKYEIVKAENSMGNWKFTSLFEIPSENARFQQRKTRPFIPGNGFTLLVTDSQIWHIPSAKTESGKIVKTEMKSFFDVRLSPDMKSFLIFGEDLAGKQLFKTYDGINGDEIGTPVIIHLED